MWKWCLHKIQRESLKVLDGQRENLSSNFANLWMQSSHESKSSKKHLKKIEKRIGLMNIFKLIWKHSLNRKSSKLLFGLFLTSHDGWQYDHCLAKDNQTSRQRYCYSPWKVIIRFNKWIALTQQEDLWWIDPLDTGTFLNDNLHIAFVVNIFILFHNLTCGLRENTIAINNEAVGRVYQKDSLLLLSEGFIYKRKGNFPRNLID